MVAAILRKWAGYETPFFTRPSSSGRLLLVEACDEYQPSKAAYSTSKRCACSALTVHAGEPNTAPVHFYCVAHFYTCNSTFFSLALSTVIPQLTKWSSHCRQGPLHRDGGTDCSTARYAGLLQIQLLNFSPASVIPKIMPCQYLATQKSSETISGNLPNTSDWSKSCELIIPATRPPLPSLKCPLIRWDGLASHTGVGVGALLRC